MLVKQDALDGKAFPNCTWFCNEPNDHHGGGEGRAQSVDHLQCHHGVNLRLVRKLVVVKNLLTNLSFVDVRKIILKLIWVCGVKLRTQIKGERLNGS